MDKTSENANLVSLIHSSKNEKTPRSQETADKDAFSKLFEKKTGQSEERADKARDAISSEKTDKAADKTPAQAEMEERLKQKLGLKSGDNSLASYLYNASLLNPDAMSLTERQSFHVGEFSAKAVDVKEFQQMLGERGLNMKDLSQTQLQQLSQHASREEMAEFLDHLSAAKKDDKAPTIAAGQAATVEDTHKDENARKTGETRSNEMVRNEQATTPGDPRFNLVRESERPQSTENQSRNEAREKVIKQIIDHMEVQTVGRRTELTMKMNPEYLGDMRVKLSTENGRLEAKFETTSREVREIIEEGWADLRDTFTRKGLNLTKVSAEVVDSVS